jgi:hypothetical protein
LITLAASTLAGTVPSTCAAFRCYEGVAIWLLRDFLKQLAARHTSGIRIVPHNA